MTKTIQFTAHETAALVDVDEDVTPLGSDEIAGRTLTSLVSPGTEINHGYLGDTFPYRPGYSAVIEVTAIGENVESIAVGDVAFVMGSHAATQRLDAIAAVPLPDGLEPKVAVFARLIGVSATTLTTTTARPPGLIAVTGLGPVGHLAAQLFNACGYVVTGCDVDIARRDLLAAKGINVCEKLETDAGFHLVVECSGHEAATRDACNAVRKGGEVVLVGVPWQKRMDMQAHDILHAVFHHYVHLRSGWEWELPVKPRDFAASSVLENFAGILRYLAEGRINVDGLYRLAPPHDAQNVYQDLLNQRGPITAVFDWASLGA